MDEAPVLADAAQAQLSLRGALMDGRIDGSGGFYDPGYGRAVPRPVVGAIADLNIAPAALSKCVVGASEWVDADEDGIPVDYTIAFGCKDQLGNDRQGNAFHYSVIGGVWINDKNDADPHSGYAVRWAGFRVERLFASGGLEKALYLDGSLDLYRDERGIGLIENYSINTRLDNGTAAHSGTLKSAAIITYTPDDATNPYAAGDVGWLAMNSFEYDGVSHRLRTRTDPKLHFQNACRVDHPGRPGWDSGAVEYADGATLRIVYSGCDGMTATLDGTPVPM